MKKTFGATQAPNPGAPLAERGKRSTRTTKKRVLLKLGAKLFLFILVLVVYKFQPYSHESNSRLMSYRHRGVSRHPGSEANRAVDFEVSTLGEISRLNLFVLHEMKNLSRVRCI